MFRYKRKHITMKNFTLSILLFLSLNVILAQNSFHFGIECGNKFTKFQYINSLGKNHIDNVFNPSYGFNFEYNKNNFTYESGVLFMVETFPLYNFNYTSFNVENVSSSTSSSLASYYIIPFRFGKQFYIPKTHFYIKPGIGIDFMFSSDFPNNGEQGYWMKYNYQNGNTPTGDSTFAQLMTLNSFNIAIEPSITIGYEIDSRFVLYLKGSYHSTLRPLSNELITHYLNSGEKIFASSTNFGNGFAVMVGLKFGFNFKKKE